MNAQAAVQLSLNLELLLKIKPTCVCMVNLQTDSRF